MTKAACEVWEIVKDDLETSGINWFDVYLLPLATKLATNLSLFVVFVV